MSEFKPVFTKGEVNPFGQFFEGTSYLNMLSKEDVSIGDVIFEPGCINHWHIHHASQGGGQILLCLAGHGWYQEEGKPAQELHAGDIVRIPANVKHWHGAAKDSWFVHIYIVTNPQNGPCRWMEPVSDEEYGSL